MSSIRFSSHILLLVLPLFSAPLTVKSQEPNDPACPLLNHFPPPHLQRYAPTTDPILGSYLKNLTNAFDTFSSNSSVAGYNTTQTSFSILISHPNYNEKTATGPIWQYHHTAQVNDPRSTKKVTSDTVFRVASVSKLLTMVGVTKAGLNLDASIVKYIPELRGKGKKGKRSWEEVTVLSLGSHLAGIQRDFGFTELAFADPTATVPGQSDLLQSLGLPPLPKAEFPPCEFPPYNPKSCTTKQLLEILSSQPPIVPPFSQPIYSNVAFALLALAIEREKSLPFEKFMQKEVFGPLNMTRTTFSQLPKDSEGSIPPNANVWGIDIGSETPGGGLYSTSSDLSKLLLSLLPSVQNKRPIFQPHPAAANKFLLPTSMVPSTNTFYLGAPWEIYVPEANHGGLTIYTKSGDLAGYSAQTVLIPEYDITMTILASGDGVANVLLNVITSYLDDGKEKGLLVGGFGGVARRETKEEYDGVYASQTKKLNSTIEFVTEKTGSSGGLIVANWASNGTNFLDSLALIRGSPGGGSNLDARVYPVDLFGTIESTSFTPGGKQMEIRKEEWKLVVTPKSDPSTAPPEESGVRRSYLDGVCFTWASMEGSGRWGDEGISRVVIWREVLGKEAKSGKILAVELPALRVVLRKRSA